jgi:hypothetical protein
MSKFSKFLEKRFKTKQDSMGIPSIIVVEGVDQHLVQSIDRNIMKSVMVKFLMDKVALTDEIAVNEAESYIDSRYKEYMNFVMSL